VHTLDFETAPAFAHVTRSIAVDSRLRTLRAYVRYVRNAALTCELKLKQNTETVSALFQANLDIYSHVEKYS